MEMKASGPVPSLRRVLTLPDLVLYGIAAVTLSAPITVLGLPRVMSRGHALDTILIAMVAMVLTAHANQILLALMALVLIAFDLLAIIYIVKHRGWMGLPCFVGAIHLAPETKWFGTTPALVEFSEI
jgi:hypothetical protein